MELQEILIILAIILGIFLLKVYQPAVYDVADNTATSLFQSLFNLVGGTISEAIAPDSNTETQAELPPPSDGDTCSSCGVG